MANRSVLTNAQRKKVVKEIKAQKPAFDFSLPHRQGDGRPQASNPGKSARERNAKAMTIETRMRHYGVTADDADKDLCGYALGRLKLKGFITDRWLAAARSYAICAARYYAAFSPEKPTPGAAHWGAVSDPQPPGDDQPKRNFEPMTPEDRLKLLADWNDMERSAGGSIQRAFVYQVVILDKEPAKDVHPLFSGLANLADSMDLELDGFEDSLAEVRAMVLRVNRARESLPAP